MNYNIEIDTTDVINNIVELTYCSEGDEVVCGNGIITSTKIKFNKSLLENKKEYIARLLNVIGIQDYNKINLTRLTFTKNYEQWNKLETLEDFQALELLLASSVACGFIVNDETIKNNNLNSVGHTGTILLSSFARTMIHDNSTWLLLIKRYIADEMKFPIVQENIMQNISKEMLVL